MEISLSLQGTEIFNELEYKLRNTQPLMSMWRDVRDATFRTQFANELNPEDRPLRSLSPAYQRWKRKNYGDKPKRYLTGMTYHSHSIYVFQDFIREEIGGHSWELQFELDLPILPMDGWTDGDFNRLGKVTVDYLLNT